MELLPDIVGPAPLVVFCGMAGADSSRRRDHYYETPGNSFWELLHRAGFLPEPLGPADDVRLPDFRLGVTDLVRHRATDGEREWFEVDELVAKLEEWRPEWLAFTSKTVAAGAARMLGRRPPGLGETDLYLGPAQVFVLPGTSGANRRHDYDGRPDRLSWWRDLAALSTASDTASVHTCQGPGEAPRRRPTRRRVAVPVAADRG